MAPALTAEPPSPNEKLMSSASPATGTRQSVRKLETPSDTVKKPTLTTITTAAATATTAAATTRVTRSKDAAQRFGSPSVQLQVNNNNNNNNKRKSNNNSNTHNNNNKKSNDQMGLSAAATHTSTDGSAASSSSGSGRAASDITAATAEAPAAEAVEHNNNCKDNPAAKLLANITNNFAEAITAEICLRKTLPELTLSKEQPTTAAAAAVDPAQVLEPPAPMSEAQSQSTSAAAAAAAALPLPTPPQSVTEEPSAQSLGPSQEQLPPSAAPLAVASEIPDCLEECLSQLDGSASVVDISAAALEASVALTSAASRQTQQQQEQLQQQQQPELLTSPQHSAVRHSGVLLTPQSTTSSINFLKDGAAGAMLEDQDIEEVLKALKTFDGSHVNPDTICDFNFFNEVCFLNNEEEAAAAAGAAATTTAAAATTSNNTAAAASIAGVAGGSGMNINQSIELESPVKAGGSSFAINARPLEESHAELVKQQHELNRKTGFLLRRMRKMQMRHMCCHASDEVAGILEWSARTSHKAAPASQVRSAKLTEQEETVLSIVSGRPPNNFWEEQTKHALPASHMSNVMRNIETAARKQQICHTIGGGSASLASTSSWYSTAAQPGKRARKPQQPPPDAISGAGDHPITPRADEIVPNFDSYVTSELTHVAGLLHTEMREVQNAIDSDATESSSGGESADEMVSYNNSQQLSLPISRRAVWRYSRDRAAIALRWSWLCAQIVDLDMKIRQQNDVYNDLCRSKGDVLLEATPAPKNGYKEQLQTESFEPLDSQSSSEAVDYLCSRARPLVLAEFRKRKLFQTTNMHTISKKAARPSNIKCGCQWPQVPCTLCTGRPDPTAPRDLPETLMPQNRVALLDPGFHPVLSFPDDVCQSVHLESISRQPDWQYRVMRSQAKAIVKSVWKAEREAIASTGGGAGGGGAGRRPGETVKRRYVRRKERNNNNNRSSNKETKTTTTAATTQNKILAGVVGLDNGSGTGSGNGTGTATTSSSSTPTTTPLVANSKLFSNSVGSNSVGSNSGQ